MNAEMELKKTVLKEAVRLYGEAFALMGKAREELDKIGVRVNTASDALTLIPGCVRNEVLISSGINIISQITETEVKSRFSDSSFGYVPSDGFVFTQQKMPVERTERYA